MSKKKYYTSECGQSNGNWIEPLGFEHTRDIRKADVIIFGGGADVEPSTYGEEPASGTYTNPNREKGERRDFKIAQDLGIPSVGICRGHQLLCALSGGKLIQDVSNHSGTHPVETFDGMVIVTNSIHHQMINPYDMEASKYRILAWTKRRSPHYIGAKDKKVYLPHNFKEIEAVYFPHTNSLGYQYHPEMMFGGRNQGEPAITWTQNIFMKFFEGKL